MQTEVEKKREKEKGGSLGLRLILAIYTSMIKSSDKHFIHRKCIIQEKERFIRKSSFVLSYSYVYANRSSLRSMPLLL